MTWLTTFYQAHKDVINLVIVAVLAMIGGNFTTAKTYFLDLLAKLTGKSKAPVSTFPTNSSVDSPDITEGLLGASDEQLNFYYVMQLRRWSELNNRANAVLTCDRLLIDLFNSVNSPGSPILYPTKTPVNQSDTDALPPLPTQAKQ